MVGNGHGKISIRHIAIAGTPLLSAVSLLLFLLFIYLSFSFRMEWFFVFALVFLILFIYFAVQSLKSGSEEIESIILSTIRSKSGATMDEIIVGAHISSEKASQELRKLISRGVIKTVDKEGKTLYVTA